jgi:hypothetical protein
MYRTSGASVMVGGPWEIEYRLPLPCSADIRHFKAEAGQKRLADGYIAPTKIGEVVVADLNTCKKIEILG